jgi:hypothetical protein
MCRLSFINVVCEILKSICGLYKGLFGRAPAPKKGLRLWLLWWSGFSNGVEAILENVWQNSFTFWIDVVNV